MNVSCDDCQIILNSLNAKRDDLMQSSKRIKELERQLAEKDAELTKLKKSCIPLSQDSKDQFIHAILHGAARNEERLTQELFEARAENETLKSVAAEKVVSRAKLADLLAEAMAENSSLWVRVESGEAAAYEQGKAEARQQVARECYKLVNTFATPDIEHVLAAIKAKFGLEGEG